MKVLKVSGGFSFLKRRHCSKASLRRDCAVALGSRVRRAKRTDCNSSRIYSRPAATFFIPSLSFSISSGDNCGRSILIVSLLNSAVNGNGGR